MFRHKPRRTGTKDTFWVPMTKGSYLDNTESEEKHDSRVGPVVGDEYKNLTDMENHTGC